MSIRIKAPCIESAAQFQRVIDDIALATVQLRKLEATRDAKLQAIRTEWEPTCIQQVDRIKALGLMAEKYAAEHRDELFPGKAKSADTPLATYGFRTGMPSLKLLSKWSWEKVLQILEQFQMLSFVRTKLEVDKDAIIREARDGLISGRQLSDIGVKLVQNEAFYIEPKEKPAEAAA